MTQQGEDGTPPAGSAPPRSTWWRPVPRRPRRRLGLLLVVAVLVGLLVCGFTAAPDLWVLATGTTTTARIGSCRTVAENSRHGVTHRRRCTGTWTVGARTYRGPIDKLIGNLDESRPTIPVRATEHRAVPTDTGRDALLLLLVVPLMIVLALLAYAIRSAVQRALGPRAGRR